ncbi:MAG: ATP-dependent helicase [Bacteroidetes bacterium]|nr:MAG: ATP-dependent helicase [Bacteroidota bacterium]
MIEHYNDIFRRELDRLNEAQRAAVGQIEGPVLVIAGPGTGKTHILTARIGRILQETDARPHNILCLTFTDAGVLAMRERLLEFIGPEAHRVHIFTFHSFCNRVIQDNLELFGRQDMEPLSDLERVEIIRKILDEQAPDHPLKKGRSDIYFYEKHLHDLFQKMKSENWTVPFVHEKIDAYLEDLPNRKAFTYQINRGKIRKGDPKTARMEEAIHRMEKLRSAAALFPRYVELLRQFRRYDFADMILWVLRAFTENTALLRTYQEQYLYFLLDEYQDTNGAQNQIALRLIEYWDNPNIFIVGDDDQSVYEFQGARLKNLTDFYHRYADWLQLVLLKENYRSSQVILDAAHALIAHNKIRIVHEIKDHHLDKKLVAAHPRFARLNIPPQVVAYPNRLQETADLVAQIEAIRDAGEPLSEVAVIYAQHSQAVALTELLEKKGIPYNTRRKVNILHLPLIQNLRTLLEYFHLETARPYSGEHLLFKILHFDFLHILPADLARLSVHLARYDYTKRPAWRAAIADRDLLDTLHLTAPDAITRFSETLEDLLTRFAGLSVVGFIEKLINRSGLLRQVIQSDDKIWRTQVLHSFVAFVKKESRRNPRLDLTRLLEMLKNMDANGLPLELNKVVLAEDGVHLLTAHSSKGLEFERVFLLDCVEDYWEPRSRRGNYRFPLPDTLTWSGEEDALEARRRLFYVALTRAKTHLHLSYARFDHKGKPLQRTRFLDETGTVFPQKAREKSLPDDQIIEAQIALLSETPPRLPEQDKTIIDELLKNFALSVSALNKYLYCPLGFYFENILNVPTLMSEAASYGQAMHHALQLGFGKMLLSKDKKFPPVADFVRFFEQEMYRLEGQFGRKEFERRLRLGHDFIHQYYRLHARDWHKNVRLEYDLKNVEMDGIPLTGMIDRLELHGTDTAHVVDYKTGSHAAKKVRGFSLKEWQAAQAAGPEGLAELTAKTGHYYRQLVFYKILYEHHQHHGRVVTSGEISYLEPDPKGHFPSVKIRFRPEDVSFMKWLIRDTWEKIMAHKFYEGCGKCKWCEFVQNNARVDSFANEIIEELDDPA